MEKNKSLPAAHQTDSARNSSTPNKPEHEKQVKDETRGIADASSMTTNHGAIDRRASDDTVVEDQGERGPQNEENNKDQDPNLVTWYGEDDPENPLNW